MTSHPALPRRRLLATGFALAASPLARPALAQPAWPTARPIEVVVGFAPGGGTDVMLRALAQAVSAELPGSNFVINNKPGAGGETSYVTLQAARPDGYTIGSVNTPGYLSVPLERRVRYDRTKIRAIARLVDDPTAFVVHQDSSFHSLADLVAEAKRRPGEISVGSSGVGTDDHLALTLFQAATGTEFIHAPFAGAGLVKNAVLAKHIDVAGLNLGEIGMLGQDKPALRPLAGMGAQRWDLMPDVPTFRELGYDVLMTSERGIGAPRGVPDEIARQLQDAIARVVAKPEWAEKARQLELPMAYLPGAEWEAQMPAQEARYRQIWETTPWQR
ncbi:tripartite tricarboxylate transporter substrate binding protein [Teichococcus vastitatis]|uniref:Tripartite tricarboxylate transporter substrate binding protein n=1 Tax=Teichococcus vastitatis TaxID=2307076 RepID=A0ABS9W8H3_9PROT|nr:tripartite tricarboxylate transporter substrate binding protein [Pseudoroseomonas vastitatis]MCI0755600.1 tripartite tricarboxylate transporter substrate binding protein [Pseudoroseomonas vastitatis]